jgi:hypothetical protein
MLRGTDRGSVSRTEHFSGPDETGDTLMAVYMEVGIPVKNSSQALLGSAVIRIQGFKHFYIFIANAKLVYPHQFLWPIIDIHRIH